MADFEAAGAVEHHLTAAVYDDRSGCWYHLRRGEIVTTASVVKLEIMAAALLRAQDERRGLSDWEFTRMTPMIHSSDDSAASALWVDLGGASAMSDYGRRWGLVATVETGPKWGLTTTTAEDQAGFVHRLLNGTTLSSSGRGLAWWELTHVRSDQQWGIRKGVPASWTVGQKNGFFDSTCCGWRVNSVGYAADPAGGGYSIAILSDEWESLGAGVPLVERVAAAVAGSLTPVR